MHLLAPKLQLVVFFFGQYIQNKELPQTAKDILLSWHDSTKDRYASTYRKWEQFCISRNINSFQPVIEDIVVFLTYLFERGLGYASICSARSALNNIIILPSYPDISEHPFIKQFVKGVFIVKPPTPCCTWDIKKVLNYVNQLPVNEELSIKLLSEEIVSFYYY